MLPDFMQRLYACAGTQEHTGISQHKMASVMEMRDTKRLMLQTDDAKMPEESVSPSADFSYRLPTRGALAAKAGGCIRGRQYSASQETRRGPNGGGRCDALEANNSTIKKRTPPPPFTYNKSPTPINKAMANWCDVIIQAKGAALCVCVFVCEHKLEKLRCLNSFLLLL